MMNEKAFSFIIYCINSGCCSFVRTPFLLPYSDLSETSYIYLTNERHKAGVRKELPLYTRYPDRIYWHRAVHSVSGRNKYNHIRILLPNRPLHR